MARLFLCVLALAIALPLPLQAATISKRYSYFDIGGRTLEEIERELERRGPKLNGSGKRHPGATRMEFDTRIGYGERNGRCHVTEVRVVLKATVILPRWRQRGADRDVRFIWETLAADIKRHEEQHVIIARNHAQELEKALQAVRPERTCEKTAARAKQVNDRIISRHDRAQDEFDRIENINFESRILRLLDYRLQRSQIGQ